MSDICVTPISTKREEMEIIRFPWRVYVGMPCWVPPLIVERKKLIDRRKNPFYKHAEAEFFLARRDGDVVGRIAAIINHNHNKEHNEQIGFFGFFESFDDQSVANALLDTAKKWVKDKGATALRGPANPSVNDEYGLLVDGFDRTPLIMMPYNPPYYGDLIEGAGLRKIKDLYAYEVRGEKVFSERLVRVSEAVRKREGLTFRSLDLKEFDREIRRIRDIYNRAWQYNWGAVPMTEEEFDALAKDLRPIVVPELVIVAEKNGDPIGFSLSLPDLNQALIHNRSGRLLPGLFHLMRLKKRIDAVRIMVLGVIRECQSTGAASVLFYETARRSCDMGYFRGEASWVLEDNVKMIRAAELLNGVRTKTYRIYQTAI